MKKLLLIIISLCFASPLLASTSVNVEWGYICPEGVDVVGFRLYQSTLPINTWEGAKTRSGIVDLTIFDEKTNYTLTAVFADGTESPHSSVYPMVVEPDDKPQVIKVTNKTTLETTAQVVRQK